MWKRNTQKVVPKLVRRWRFAWREFENEGRGGGRELYDARSPCGTHKIRFIVSDHRSMWLNLAGTAGNDNRKNIEGAQKQRTKKERSSKESVVSV